MPDPLEIRAFELWVARVIQCLMEYQELDATRSTSPSIEETFQKLVQLTRDWRKKFPLPNPNYDVYDIPKHDREQEKSEKKTVPIAETIEEVQKVTNLPILPLPSGKYLCTCQQCENTRSWVSAFPPPRCSNTEYRHSKWWFPKLEEGEPDPPLPDFVRRIIAKIRKE